MLNLFIHLLLQVIRQLFSFLKKKSLFFSHSHAVRNIFQVGQWKVQVQFEMQVLALETGKCGSAQFCTATSVKKLILQMVTSNNRFGTMLKF